MLILGSTAVEGKEEKLDRVEGEVEPGGISKETGAGVRLSGAGMAFPSCLGESGEACLVVIALEMGFGFTKALLFHFFLSYCFSRQGFAV
jgi:hypothetical protein